ncbi:surface antigen-domain-containing protein [Pisolithus thermaeus]|nr:surface antigen-domain-containing protein [Pisolithus thermaeus]
MADALKPPLQSTVRPSDREPSQDDLEKLRAWHEERLQRKLRGEYESQQLHLAELVNDTLDCPLRIASVKVHGATHTSKAFLDWLIRPRLTSSQSDHATNAHPTLHSVLQTTRSISHSLSATDLFRTVSARIERSPEGTPGDVDLNFAVTERGRFFVKTATEIGNCEGSASITARLTNVLGRADTLTFNSSVGTKTKRAFDASFSLPVSPSLTTTAFLSLVGADRELGVQGGSGREERVAIKAGLRHGGDGLENGVHELTAEALWRSIGNLAPEAGLGIRQSAGPALKAALAHRWTIDTLNDHIMPSKGALIRIANELGITKRIVPSPFPGYAASSLWSTSNIGNNGDMGEGSSAFWKVEAEAKRGWALTSGSALSLCARSGLLRVLAGNSDTLHWSDRFQLGGPLSVRGFSADGMGPREGSTSLGGTIYYALGLSLLGNVPTRPTWPIKLHSWVNAGRLQDHGQDVRSTVRTLLTRPSLSAGVGLVYRVDPIRVEANVAFPLVAARGEGLRRGIQVGIGLEML